MQRLETSRLYSWLDALATVCAVLLVIASAVGVAFLFLQAAAVTP